MRAFVESYLVHGAEPDWVYKPTGRLIHAAPDGKPDGDGSPGKPLDVATALGKKSPASPGDAIVLAAGTYEGKMDGIKRVPFEWAVSGTVDKTVLVMPAPGAAVHLNGTASLTSSHAWFFNLEVGDLKWDPYQKAHRAETVLNATGGDGARIINCNVFGGAMGTGLWSSARNTEVYGCLVHDFGTLAGAGRGHGHAFYTQNETGTKTYAHNVAWRGCGWNLHVYTQSGQINGFDIIQNIFYLAGAYKEGQTMDNFLVAGYVPADRIRLLGNVGYQPSRVEAWRPNVRLSHFKPVVNGTAVVRDNYFAGANYGLSLGNWKDITVTGNTVWAYRFLVEINSSPTGVSIPSQPNRPDLRGYKLDGNTYVANGHDKAFVYGRNEKPPEDEILGLAEWQKLGLDKESKLLSGREGKPTGTRVFVFPNRHEKGRAHVAIFNWDGESTVAVGLSGVLAKGQSFAIYNCLDIKTTLANARPVHTGTCEGGSIAFPMRKDPLSPDFDAFLVLPRAP